MGGAKLSDTAKQLWRHRRRTVRLGEAIVGQCGRDHGMHLQQQARSGTSVPNAPSEVRDNRHMHSHGHIQASLALASYTGSLRAICAIASAMVKLL